MPESTGRMLREKGAYICGDHRYHLYRSRGGGARSVLWVMLNPSTADAMMGDATLRKCMGFTERFGFGSLDILNLYTYRTKSPRILSNSWEKNGPDADQVIQKVLGEYVDRVVYGWGSSVPWLPRAREVDALVRAAGHVPKALSVNADGAPAHPLYLPYTSELTPWTLPGLTPPSPGTKVPKGRSR